MIENAVGMPVFSSCFKQSTLAASSALSRFASTEPLLRHRQ